MADNPRFDSAASDGHSLILDFTDDGPSLMQMPGLGHGTRGMRNRAEQPQGSIDRTPGSTGGTQVVLRFPSPA